VAEVAELLPRTAANDRNIEYINGHAQAAAARARRFLVFPAERPTRRVPAGTMTSSWRLPLLPISSSMALPRTPER